MMGLLVLKERLKACYGKYDIYINAVIKFAYSLTAFLMLNQNIGYMEKLKNPIVSIIISFICAFLPSAAISIIAAAILLLNLFNVSLEIALITGVFILILALLYYGFRPGDSYLLILTPMLFLLRIPYAIPLIAGLSGSLISIIPISSGVLFYFIISYVKENAGVLTNDASLEITQKYIQILKTIMSNKFMLVMLAAFAVGVLVVFVIRNLSIDYSWSIAIIIGTIAQLAIIFIGDFVADISIAVGQLIIGIAASALVALIYHFFIFAVDYTRTEYLQFEDDDYYYYVKAVPKIAVSTPDVKVQKINSRKSYKNSR